MRNQLLVLAAFVAIVMSVYAAASNVFEQRLGNSPPMPEIVVNDESINVYQSSYCWKNRCADYPRPDEMLKDKRKISVAANSIITYEFEGKEPTEIRVSRFYDQSISRVENAGNSFRAPGKEGTYYYALSAAWFKDTDKRITEGSSSYAFAIQVTH